jgi:methyl-accepting chemotaxis protein
MVAAVGTWHYKPGVETSLLELVEILQDSLETTESGIVVLQSTLDTSETNLTTVENSLINLGITIESISPSLTATATMMGEDMKQAIIDTQVSLSSAAASAKIIDDTLSLLASIPLLGLDYQPEVPLHMSLNQAADNLDSMPESFDTIEDSLNQTADSLDLVKSDIDQLAEDIGLFNEDLSDAAEVLTEYKVILDETTIKVNTFEDRLPDSLTATAGILTGFIMLLLVAQVSALTQGMILLRGEVKVVKLSDLDR